jgi:large subunit ribosomal protein L25
VECTVTEIPESIDVSVKAMKVDDSIYARDIVLPAGVKLVTGPEVLVIACHIPLVIEPVAAEAVAAEEPTSPEVLTERKPKEGEEEAGAAPEKEKK